MQDVTTSGCPKKVSLSAPQVSPEPAPQLRLSLPRPPGASRGLLPQGVRTPAACFASAPPASRDRLLAHFRDEAAALQEWPLHVLSDIGAAGSPREMQLLGRAARGSWRRQYCMCATCKRHQV